jgi:hypothetical protein
VVLFPSKVACTIGTVVGSTALGAAGYYIGVCFEGAIACFGLHIATGIFGVPFGAKLQLAEMQLLVSQHTCIGGWFLCCTPRFNLFNCSSGWLDVSDKTEFCCGSIRDRQFKAFASFQLPLRKHLTKP